MIEEIEIISEFKYIEFKYQEIYDRENIMKLYNKNIYNWIILKDNIYFFLLINVITKKWIL